MPKCNLAVLMAERKMSIQDVANKTGLSRTTISALVNETGKGIQFETMDVLCELFNITPGDLLTCRFRVEKIVEQLTEDRVREIVREELYTLFKEGASQIRPTPKDLRFDSRTLKNERLRKEHSNGTISKGAE